jgi:GDPmannose 4,6-dehydratase
VNSLLGDASKAEKELGWTPQISFHKLVKEMMTCDY